MSGKPVAEQEIGHALLQEVVAFAETSMSRRKFILHYFGEEFDNETGEGGIWMIICAIPKKNMKQKTMHKQLLEVVAKTNEKYKSKEMVNVLVGKVNALIKSHRTDAQEFFGSGANHDAALLDGFVTTTFGCGIFKKGY